MAQLEFVQENIVWIMAHFFAGFSLDRDQADNISNLLNDDKFCDVTFIIGKEAREFKLNRIFLAAISEVFKAMLYGGS